VLMTDNGRVRVAARLRPRNAEELILDADFNDCVELLPEVIFFYFPVCFMC
jgi:kinesin family protein 5